MNILKFSWLLQGILNVANGIFDKIVEHQKIKYCIVVSVHVFLIVLVLIACLTVYL